MKNLKYVIIVVVLGIIFFPNIKSQQLNELEKIWESRIDLQKVFPDGENGVNQMKGWTLEQWAGEFGWKEYESLKWYNTETEKDYICEKYLPLERALQEISENSYDVNNYNCTNFTKDLQEQLNKENIASVAITGKTPDNKIGEYHRWIAIQFEPFNGEFIKVSDGFTPMTISD